MYKLRFQLPFLYSSIYKNHKNHPNLQSITPTDEWKSSITENQKRTGRGTLWTRKTVRSGTSNGEKGSREGRFRVCGDPYNTPSRTSSESLFQRLCVEALARLLARSLSLSPSAVCHHGTLSLLRICSLQKLTGLVRIDSRACMLGCPHYFRVSLYDRHIIAVVIFSIDVLFTGRFWDIVYAAAVLACFSGCHLASFFFGKTAFRLGLGYRFLEHHFLVIRVSRKSIIFLRVFCACLCIGVFGFQPSQKTFRIKKKLAKKLRQNRPIPHWIRMRTDNTIRYGNVFSDTCIVVLPSGELKN